MIQDIIVGIIAIIVLALIGKRLYTIIKGGKNGKNNKNGCSGCSNCGV